MVSNDSIESNITDTTIPAMIRGFIFNLNELEINKFKELFNSVSIVRNHKLKSIEYETVCASEAFHVLVNGVDLMLPRMARIWPQITGFNELCEDDKIVLLKTSCPQIMTLQSIMLFDFEGQFWTIPIVCSVCGDRAIGLWLHLWQKL
ncbi:unnamed protein product [Medioppia subpectinata]|uniref:Uncharacterized protein n=1 Tax=Medioppia subpectinata TaxID=1979941 RepID=A0A7R9L981_9ACAR|nr:unnamed protein product [Medioppia subpectinata]CAG2116955.1 unnamed protein product [Medioppia subpectinata]